MVDQTNGSQGSLCEHPHRRGRNVRNAHFTLGFGSTPGGTRTPNLLIRRSPSGVHGRPQPSTQPRMKGLHVRGRPQPSTTVHSEWLPTWLPACHQRSVGHRHCNRGAFESIDSATANSHHLFDLRVMSCLPGSLASSRCCSIVPATLGFRGIGVMADACG